MPFKILAALALALTPTIVQAQTTEFPAARVAFFYVEQVATESVIGKAALAELEAQRARLAGEIDTQQQTLTAEQQRFQQSLSVLGAEARVEMQRRLQQLEIDLQRTVEDAQTDLLALQQRIDGDFSVQLTPAIATVAEEHDLHFVFARPDPYLVYADPRFDLTAEIITRLDQAAANGN